MSASFDKLSAEKRLTILGVCMDVFIEYGYALANTNEIAQRCGIAKGSIFHYFGSKRELFLYVCRHCMDTVLGKTREALTGSGEGTYFDRARRSVAAKLAVPQACPKETQLLAKAAGERGHDAADELVALMGGYAAQMRTLSAEFLGSIEPELLRDGVDLGDAQEYIRTVFDGVTARVLQTHSLKKLLEDPVLLEAELDKTIRFILHGIGRDE